MTVTELDKATSEGGQSEDDYSNDAAPNLAWAAMLRLADRRYPDHKD